MMNKRFALPIMATAAAAVFVGGVSSPAYAEPAAAPAATASVATAPVSADALKQAFTDVATSQGASAADSSAAGSATGGDFAAAEAWANTAKSRSVVMCESHGNYQINTGNGYYGGWQFDHQSWLANGGGQYANYPHQATKEQQDQIAYNYYQKAGWRPWQCA